MNLNFPSAIVVLLIALSSCAPKAVIVEPIAPAVIHARATVSTAAATAVRVKTGVVEIRAEAQAITREAMAATSEVDRLRKLDSRIPPQEFDALWMMVSGLSSKTLTHEKSIEEVSAAANEASEQANESISVLAELEATAITHDKGVGALKTQVVEQAENAAVGKYAKRTFWIATVAAVFCLLAFLLIRFVPGIVARFIKPI